jgi:hypothetical protein
MAFPRVPTNSKSAADGFAVGIVALACGPPAIMDGGPCSLLTALTWTDCHV